MKRFVEPEWLDDLPPNDPRARQSRLDLRRVNFFMGNAGTVARELERLFPNEPPRRIVELGAGDGTFALQLAKRFSPRWKNVQLVLVDRQNLFSPEAEENFTALKWDTRFVIADVFNFLQTSGPADCVFANLFLHHFEKEKLSALLKLVAAKSKRFVACEPRRSRIGVTGTKLLRLIGCNDVTRHDAAISVRAGFKANEISELWPAGWEIAEHGAGLFSHSFVAGRF